MEPTLERRRILFFVSLFVASHLVFPAIAHAQGTSGIAGIVKDPSGAVMPGVTVEASSPALIERVRSVVSDSEGQYRILDLRPGTYSVTFSLPGFSTVKRDGIELSAGFTGTVNAELRVGSLEETITVSGASPLVDTQNVAQQKIIARNVLDTVPGSRTNFAAFTPGASMVADVGGSAGNDAGAIFTIHGSKSGDTRRLIDGMRWNSMEGTNSGTGFYFNPATAEEVAIQLGNNSAEYELGGVQVNLVPKVGANTFKGYFFTTYTDHNLENDNLSDELRNRGLTLVSSVDKIWDVSGTLGGPIKRDKLWFFTAQRSWGNSNFVAGNYYNKNTAAWIYEPDLSRPAVNDNNNRHQNARLTWQVSQRNKLNLTWEWQDNQVLHSGLTGQSAPEGIHRWNFGPPNYILQGTWNFPITNKVMLEAGATSLIFDFPTLPTETLPLGDTQISVLETSRNYRYRSSAGTFRYGHKVTDQSNQRFTVAYVTGAHAFKTGIQVMEGWRNIEQKPNGSMDYTFTNGQPISLTQWATPIEERMRLKAAIGLFAQDQWTVRRLTLNLGLRFDYLNAFNPAISLPAGPFMPVRRFDQVDCVPCWKDIGPRAGFAYDLFGNGKTAIKADVGRYVAGEGVALATANHPLETSVTSTTRTWGDANHDYVPDCNLTNPAQNGECGAIDNVNFGLNNPRAARYGSDVLTGWRHRNNNWQTSASIQHEFLGGMAMNVGYFRRWYGNFQVTENRAVSPADFSTYCITAPVDPRLPGGGGYQVCGLYDVNPTQFGQVQSVISLNTNYGSQTEVYDGVDVTLSARFKRGAFLAGGFNTGRTETNNCDVVMGRPQVTFTVALSAITGPRTQAYCDVVTPWRGQTQLKFAGAYPLP